MADNKPTKTNNDADVVVTQETESMIDENGRAVTVTKKVTKETLPDGNINTTIEIVTEKVVSDDADDEKKTDEAEKDETAADGADDAEDADDANEEEIDAAESAEDEAAEELAEATMPGPKKPRKTFNILLVILCLLAIGMSGFSLFANYTNLFRRVNWANFDDGNKITFMEGTIAEVANRVSSSVVSILTETRVQSWYGQSSTASAAGTGFIVTKDGYVVTNKHVIEGAEKVSIVLDSGKTYDANEVEVVGTDPSNDVAFLKIKGATDLPAATLGDSKTITVGQQVIAIGNALGQYQNTVTEGIISGTGRIVVAADSNGQNAEKLTDMVQTDAAINAGNSGGPLVNAAGQVIGINTAVGSGNNLGFAIPISSIKGMLKSITETGKIQRAYLGVYYDSLTTDSAKKYGLSVTAGAYVHNSNGNAVIADSPAAKAGIKDGDVIVRVNGAKVGENGSLGTLIGEYAPGDTISLTIWNDGSERTVDVTLAEYPTTEMQQKN